jgi:hypothetical protein
MFYEEVEIILSVIGRYIARFAIAQNSLNTKSRSQICRRNSSGRMLILINLSLYDISFGVVQDKFGGPQLNINVID